MAIGSQNVHFLKITLPIMLDGSKLNLILHSFEIDHLGIMKT